MMQAEAVSLSATFDAAIAQNAQFDFDMPVPTAIGGAFGTTRCRIKGIAIISEENIAWELWAWTQAARSSAAFDADSWVGRWTFVTTDAVQSGSDTRYRYWIPDLDVPYEDDDAGDVRGLLHLSLIPRGAAHVIHKKIVIKVFCEPEVAWS